MEPLDINTVFGVAIGYIVAQVARWLARRRFWAAVVSRARSYLDDPAVPLDTPERAAAAALVDEQLSSVQRVASQIAPNGTPNGKH